MNEEYQSMAANAVCHAANMVMLSMQQAVFEYEHPCVIFKPKLMREGSKWMALFGDNIQEGVCGFGDSPREAMLQFDLEWNKKL